MLKKITFLKIKKSKKALLLTELGDLALYFEVASLFREEKLQRKINRFINRLNDKTLKGIFDDFRKICTEIKKGRYSREIETILREILIPEMSDEYKKIILQTVWQKFQGSQVLKEMEKIQDGNKEIERIVEKLVKMGMKKEEVEEAYN